METVCILPELNVESAVNSVINSLSDILICIVLKFTD